MKTSIFLAFFVFGIGFGFSQDSDLAGQHSVLTTDCKSIRGHASRIIAEASEAQLNRAVALAHLGEVEKYHTRMEEHLKTSKELLTPAQLKTLKAEYEFLEKTCKNIGDLVESLQQEFDKKNEDRLAIRDLAKKLHSEMSDGYSVHERLKKKLGIS